MRTKQFPPQKKYDQHRERCDYQQKGSGIRSKSFFPQKYTNRSAFPSFIDTRTPLGNEIGRTGL